VVLFWKAVQKYLFNCILVIFTHLSVTYVRSSPYTGDQLERITIDVKEWAGVGGGNSIQGR